MQWCHTAMALHGRVLLLQLALVTLLVAAATTRMLAAAQALPNCNEKCGDISVQYPFGLTDGCFLQVPGKDADDQPFKITCNHNTAPPSLQFLSSDTYASNVTDITNISVGEGELQVMVATSRNCYINNTYTRSLYRPSVLNLPPSYTISEKNKLISIGCNKVAMLQGYLQQVTDPEQPFSVGFSGVSLCQNEFGKRFPETCTGFGCSMNPVPSGMKNYTVEVWTVGTGLGITTPWAYSYPCSYGFIVDELNFTFAGNKTFDELNDERQELPVLTNWAIGHDNCEAAKKNNPTSFACKGVNTKCVDRAGGYFCQCETGYAGNPYLLNDCLDINECKNSTLCSAHARCINSIGWYTCKCDKGYRNDDSDMNSCVQIKETSSKNNKEMQISLGVCLSFLMILVITFWLYCGMKRRKFKQLKEKYFKDNGGYLLQQKLENFDGPQAAKIFTKEELKKATNNFDDSGKIGEGGYGFVYKGTLPDKKEVAIKVSKSNAPMTQSNQFINEVIVLSQINHRNVVRLLGCCLETQTPLLVYEFVSNGTLYEHIHKKNGKGPLSFGLRMKIATETAGSLAYLHYSTSMQIVHRDVKATNILLDENFTAKVSDFGASKLVPDDQNQLSTLVQGTLGYLDPEYLQSNTLTEKSDVYSFGVVLVELITSQVAISYKKPEAERNLANLFVTAVEENRLDQILDHEIIKEGSFEIAEQVAHLGKKCLSLKGGNRPTMKEVAMELEAILTVMAKHPGEKPDASPKETDYLLASPPSNAYVVDVRGDEGELITSIDYDQSMKNQAQILKHDEGGR